MTNQNPHKNQRVLIAGNFTFPKGSASSSRVRMLAKALQHSGARPIAAPISALLTKQSERSIGKVCVFDGIPFVALNARYKDPARRPIHKKLKDGARATLKLWFFSARLSRSQQIDGILLYGRSFVRFAPLVIIAKVYGIRLSYDAVEWFNADTYRGGFLNPLFWNSRLGSLLPFFGFKGVSCITEYLANIYKDKINATYVIPSLYDFQSQLNLPTLSATGTCLKNFGAETCFTLTYAGTLKEGEDFSTLLKAIEFCAKNEINVQLTVLGLDSQHPSAAHYAKQIEENPSLRERVNFLGRVSDETYLCAIRRTNCLVLPRSDSPTTRAGFPTRLPEFLHTGNPVITTNIPDINRYLLNQIDAELVQPGDASDFASAVKRLYEDKRYSYELGQRGREKAAYCFDYRSYAQPLRALTLGD